MTASLSTLFWVGLGSALGGMGRYGVAMWVQRQFSHEFPWGTWTVNVVGSFVIGMLAMLSGNEGHWMSHPHAQRFFIVGLLGGFTTFSSFSLQTLQLFQQGHTGLALLNICLSLMACLLFVWLGANVATKLVLR
jgi:CrcB protein